MAENTSVEEVKNTVVEDVKVEEEKRFTINVDSGTDEEGNKKLFSFSGPEKASLGLIYDAVHRIMMEVISILQKRAEELKPKKADDIDVSKEENKDTRAKDTHVEDTHVEDTSVEDK